MYNIKTLNAISPVYQNILKDAEYNVSPEAENPEAILVRSADMHSYAINENLLCVARAGAGVNNLPLDKLAESGIVAFNAPGANANAVKELVVAGLLLASRKIAEGIEWCKTLTDGETSVEKQVEAGKSQFTGPELAGKTLGVVGLGAIGVHVANIGVNLGMDVLGYDPYISIDHAWKLSRAVQHATTLEEILEKSDYITLHVPLMDSTKNMINAATLAQMKPRAALLNFARDGLVNHEDVKAALDRETLRVYVTDFPCKDLIGAKNAILTPHLGASTPESEDNCVRMAAQQIDNYIKYGSIENSVNFPNCRLGRLSVPRITLLHKNVPNVISSITMVLSEEALNIENMINVSRGSYAYTVVDVGCAPSQRLIDKLGQLDTMYKARLLMP
ncbi:MAG: 3-phosphoglycerate dehydrogenase [Clostridia bacterium]|nr:3-phosphoglycerate dehydrogenase [Clostridia bacterium]